MLKRKPATEKLLLLGVDGMDPSLTSKYVAQGKMPNVKKMMERGASGEDLVLLGGHPTVTPPMWTTLATGCYSNVHGITGFWRSSESKTRDYVEYNLDSRLCEAEPLWNVTAEAGLKTLVWHWPGSAWPPTSDSPNLMVVDGTSPGSVGMAVATVDAEFFVGANVEIKELEFTARAASDAVAPCVVENLELDKPKDVMMESSIAEMDLESGMHVMVLTESQRTTTMTENPSDVVRSPIKEPSGWENAPTGSKEFTIMFSKGLIRRPCLVLKNEKGVYDRVALYKSKKDAEPIVTMETGVMARQVIDEAVKPDGKRYRVNRNIKLLTIEPDGSRLSMWVSAAMDTENDSVWHPKRLFKEVAENIGYPTPTTMLGNQDKLQITDCMLDNWYVTADWQSASILHLIETEKLDVVFSHFHAIDLQTHMFIKHLADKDFNRLPHEAYEKFIEDVYVQTDYYLGKFVHLLDEGWTLSVFSDHAQVAPKHDIQWLGEISGVNVRLMQELGFTVLKTDAQGNELPEIDWTKTKAIAQREGFIYINLKGRDSTGIVDPADKYELEEEIMTALYGYKDKKTGHRVVSVALRNRDAVLLGQGGPHAGDICYWLAEGYNYDHADCLSTTRGEADTSVSPIFLMAGKGVKQNCVTKRIIRQIDTAPTWAVLAGVRMPAQCEGAPAYQILEQEY
ncbi:MAG: alkaline phosphatase family protein [Gracilibacteraceae bacterium]|jgi:predicted AlkP superfamily phosphohydrolase/phosphomutase|nr:alkaline phosphatase family protein [Gracilibacteraceae bacterium]